MALSRLTQTCIDLVDIQSVSRNEADIEAYLTSVLPSSFSWAYQNDSVLFVTSPRRDNRELIVLAGHTDTVPIEDNWPSRVDGDIIYGRGAADMKAGLAVMIELARWVDENRFDLAFDVGLLFFGREELPANECHLFDALNNDEFADISLAFLMEPTNNAIEAGCMGNLNLKVTFSGKSAHSARPWQGKNAAHAAIVALQDFVRHESQVVLVNDLEFTEVANVTQIHSGTALNVIPHEAEFSINVRYAPNRSPDEAEKLWRDYFASLGASVAVIGNARSAPVTLDHSIVSRLQAAGQLDVRAKQAWTNVADFAAYKIPAVNFGPGDPFYAHKQDEQVNISALQQSLSLLQKCISEGTR